ncbi:TetR/AcrR family transcriptional regulator [Halopseudomonas maritima]|uniref:TetR/AcrR family transcriptional regulator n=1 Tax=Halopseudomonas maritima TaxID=2918528 RepID=UPI001EEC4064|nr:TetR/AcrR family transcriptional regulator [Halopseudomonas maritima]UJJ32519.1 TetR/AcrR family transcriptional regulator [Halopseudomonas maritima]
MSVRKSGKRAAIIEAAVDQFQQHGYMETSMDRIAEAAQVSKRTVYNHFASKELLFDAIRQELIARCGRLLLPDPGPGSMHAQLVEVGRRYAQLMISDDFVKLVRVVLSRFIQSPQVAGATITGREPQMPIQAWLECAQEGGLLPAFDAVQATTEFAGLITAMEFWPRMLQEDQLPTSAAREAYLSSIAAMFLKHYAPHTL